jgi:hypothetical protein
VGLFKKKCQHNYVYYAETVGLDLFSRYPPYIYKWVCTKCEKELSVSGWNIDNEVKIANEKVAKEYVLGRIAAEQIREQEHNKQFMIRLYNMGVWFRDYYGLGAKMVKEDYLKQGIDLGQIKGQE